MAIGGEMAEEKLWDYDLPVNGNQATSPISFDSGDLSPGRLLRSSSDHRPQPDYNFTSFLEEFEKENSLAPNPEENATIAEEESPSNSSTGMMDYIPAFVDQDVAIEESASFSSLVHRIASLPNEKFLEIILGTSNISTEGQQTPVTFSEDGVQEQEGGLDNVPRLTATFDNSTRPRVCWTPEMHARFVRAVKQLGGYKSAKPKDILQLLNVDGLSRNHVTSHLQLHRHGKCSICGDH